MKVKIRRSYIVILTILTLSLSSCSSKDKQNAPSEDAVDVALSKNAVDSAPSKEAIEAVKTELEMFSKLLPIEGGVGMLITEVNYDEATNAIHYTYQYTIPGVSKPSDSQLIEAKKTAVSLIKTQAKDRKLLEQGFTYRYDYYDRDGEFLFTQEITAADLKEN